MRKILPLLLATFIFSFLTTQAQINNPWEVPEEYNNMENPVDADKASVSEGKTLYKQHCKICHGKDGKGDGTQAENLQVNPSDLTFDDVDAQKDGALFYKIKTGQGEMHAYQVVLEEKDIWNIVNYIRTFYEE